MKNILLAAGLACVPSFSFAASDCYIVAGKYQETAAQGLSTADHVQAAASAINACKDAMSSFPGASAYTDTLMKNCSDAYSKKEGTMFRMVVADCQVQAAVNVFAMSAYSSSLGSAGTGR